MLTQLGFTLLSLVFINNIALAQPFAINAFFAQKSSIEKNLRFSLFVSACLIIASLINYSLYHYVLLPLGGQFLALSLFMLIISASVFLSANLYQQKGRQLGFSPYLALGNSALLAASLSLLEQPSFFQALFASVALSFGFLLVSLLFACASERLNAARIPPAFQGAPIALISLGLASLALLGIN